jgi:hypothetical protein
VLDLIIVMEPSSVNSTTDEALEVLAGYGSAAAAVARGPAAAPPSTESANNQLDTEAASMQSSHASEVAATSAGAQIAAPPEAARPAEAAPPVSFEADAVPKGAAAVDNDAASVAGMHSSAAARTVSRDVEQAAVGTLGSAQLRVDTAAAAAAQSNTGSDSCSRLFVKMVVMKCRVGRGLLQCMLLLLYSKLALVCIQ